MRPSSYLILRSLVLFGLIACQPRGDAKPTAQRLSLVPLPSPAGPHAAEPFVSATRDGKLTLSWLERGPDSVTAALRVSSLGDNGLWGAPSDVVRAKNLFVNWADFPSVVSLSDGRLLAHWLQRNGAGKYAYDVKLAQSTDGGRTWSPGVTPHGDGIPAEHGFVSLLPRNDGSADVFFLNGQVTPPGVAEGQGPPMRLAHARWTTNGQVAAPAAILDERTCDCCQTAAAMTSRGAVVLYRDRSDTETRDIYVRRQLDTTWTAPVPLHADHWTINACPVNGPAISARGDTVAAVWFTGARDTAKVQLVFSRDAGATFGAPVRIDGGEPSGRVDVELLPTGEAVVTWIERVTTGATEIRARLVRPDGTVEAPFTIAAIPQGRASGFPRMALHAGALTLAWTEPATPATPGTVRVAELRIAPR